MLKVFLLNSPVEKEYKSLFRSLNNSEDITDITIKEKLPFKYLTINNAESNRYVLSLHSIKFKVKDENTATLFMGDNLVLEKDLKVAGRLTIGHEVNLKAESNYIELYSVKTYPNTIIDLLFNHYVILSPGGSLIIELKKETEQVELTLISTAEEF